MVSNITWFPPEPLVLQFDFCFQAVALWSFYDPTFSQKFRDHGRSFFDAKTPDSQNAKIAITLLLQGLRDYTYDDDQLERPSNDEIWQYMKGPVVNNTVTDYVITKCLKDRCALLDWEGDAELTGIGMLATYSLQAFLTTIYLSALVSAQSGLIPRQFFKRPWVPRFLLAIQHSTTTLLYASFLFSVAMLLAAVNNLAFLATNMHLGPASPNWGLYVLVPVSSVLPMIALQLATASTLRRVRGRSVLWAIIAFLLATILALSGALHHQWSVGPSTEQKKLEVYCLRITSLSQIVYTSNALAAAIALCIGVSIASRFFPLRVRQHVPVNAHKWVRWSGVFSAFILMWTCYGLLINTLIEQSKLGIGMQDGWSFGQVLSLTTWFPVLVEFGYVWWQSPVVALSGRLMVPYEVVEMSKEEPAFAMRRVGIV